VRYRQAVPPDFVTLWRLLPLSQVATARSLGEWFGSCCATLVSASSLPISQFRNTARRMMSRVLPEAAVNAANGPAKAEMPASFNALPGKIPS
jgi:hypothetical protein